MNELKIFEVEEDYTWICAYTKEKAKEIYIKEMGWTESDWECHEKDYDVCPLDELEPASDWDLDNNFYYGDGTRISFRDELAKRTEEGIFAVNWD